MLNKTGFVDAAKYGLIILMFLLFIYTSYFMSGYYLIPSTTSYYVLPEVGANAGAYYSRVVTPGEMEATGWINESTNKTDKFVADIFGAELIMGMTTRVSTVGGDWANAPDPGQVMSDTELVYTTDDPKQAYDLAKKYNCSYVWLPNRKTFSGYYWLDGDHGKFDDTQYFRIVYNNSDVSIYKVL